MIRILHFEKYKVLRDSIKSVIRSHPMMHYAGEAETVDEVMRILPLRNIDVIIMDMVACEDCLSFCIYMKTNYPAVKLILHTGFKHSPWLQKMIRENVKGFVSKYAGVDELTDAIHAVYQGDFFVSSIIRSEFKNIDAFLVDTTLRLKTHKPLLTSRETDIIQLVAKGNPTKIIAEALHLGEKTIETHRKNIIDKLGVKNTAELMVYATTSGLLRH